MTSDGKVVALIKSMSAGGQQLESKLDAPSVAGTNGQVLTSNGDGTTSWTDAATPEQIADTVTTWLGQNISDGAVVDASLSVTGAAADAKTTGDTISELTALFSSLGLSVVNGAINLTYEEVTA